MSKYIFQPVAISAENFSKLQNFSCGVKLMDEILHSQVLAAELNTLDPQAYYVFSREKGSLLAFYIVGKICMPIDDGHLHYVEMVDIACLAVAKEYQGQHIGTDILDHICEQADSIVPDGDFIHVEALDLDDGSYSAVGFYERYGFRYSSRAGADAARMFLMLGEKND